MILNKEDILIILDSLEYGTKKEEKKEAKKEEQAEAKNSEK